ILLCTMSSMNDDTSHYEGALLEDIQHKLAAILEGQQSLAHVPRELAELRADVADVKTNVKAIKAAIAVQSADTKDLKSRVATLEKAAA
ncbi:MAG: hypothetical protein LC808_12045, partial [Actinobacteria bacterium]|nr:hypothetical protein [Actinomycetota bacterium]